MAERTYDSELDRLLERSRRDDPDAWAALVSRLQALVYSIPRRYRLNEDDASDVFMVAFQSLYRNLDRIESGNALPRWVATTAARESLKLIRIKGRTTSDAPLDEIVASEEIDAEVEAVRADNAERVQRGLSDLAGRCRDLLSLLYRDEETPYTEIAKTLNIPMGAIGPTRARCLEKLRRIMEADGFFE